jgi:hypothetical protein
MTEKPCRHCGELFTPPKPPAKPFGHFVDECRECSDSLYRPVVVPAEPSAETETTKARGYRNALERSFRERGWTPSRIAQRMREIQEIRDL